VVLVNIFWGEGGLCPGPTPNPPLLKDRKKQVWQCIHSNDFWQLSLASTGISIFIVSDNDHDDDGDKDDYGHVIRDVIECSLPTAIRCKTLQHHKQQENNGNTLLLFLVCVS